MLPQNCVTYEKFLSKLGKHGFRFSPTGQQDKEIFSTPKEVLSIPLGSSFETAYIYHLGIRLGRWCGRTIDGTGHRLRDLLRRLLIALIKPSLRENSPGTISRDSERPIRQLEGAIADSHPPILPARKDFPGESGEVHGNGNGTTRETQCGNEQGRVDKTSMPFLHLGVNFESRDAPGRKAIEEVLNKAKDWYRYAPNCWLIYTARSAKYWSEKISAIPGMEQNASFLICDVLIYEKDKRDGWLSQSAWDWINKERVSWKRESY